MVDRGRGVPPVILDGRLVGRAVELAQLERWLDEACAGTPRFVLLSGDPGMGTTRLADEALARARLREMSVLVGRCFEDVAVPYLPLVSALRALLTSARESRPALRSLPGLGDLSARPDADELALYVGVAEALIEASRDAPVALALDAVQWADRPTLDLLAHIVGATAQAARAERVPILVLLTMGDVEPDTASARTIGRIAREAGARSLGLHGLDPVEVHDLLLDLAPARPSRRLSLEVAEATGGNPLLIRELLDRLIGAGAAVEQDGELVLLKGTLPVVALHPDDAAERRLGALGPAARELLVLAAFLGDGCDVADLELVSGLEANALDDLIDEATEAGCLRDDGDDRVHFAKARFRQVLFHQPTRRRREQMHRRIAEVLASRGDEGDAMAVAHHLLRSGPTIAPDTLSVACARAGERAFGLGAWSLAAWYYDEAAKATEDAGLDVEALPLVELHLRAGEAAQHDVDPLSAEPHLSRAIDLARADHDLPRWGRALFSQMRLRMTSRGIDVDPASLLDFVAAAGDDVPDLRAEALAMLAEYQFTTADTTTGIATAERALELARSVGDEVLVAHAWFAIGQQHLGTLAPAQADQCFETGLTHARAAHSARYSIWNSGRLPLARWQLGDLTSAVEACDSARSLATTHQYWGEHSLACSIATGLAVAQGRFADAERSGEEALQTLRRTDYTWTPSVLFAALAACRALRGDQAGAHEALAAWRDAWGGRPHRLSPVVDAAVGDRTAVDLWLAATPWRDAATRTLDLFSLPSLAAQVEVADAVGDTRLLGSAIPLLTEAVEQGVSWVTGWPFFLPRLLGVATMGVGDHASARDWFEVAADQAKTGPSSSELGRVDFDRARLAALQGDRVLATSMLVSAAMTFDEIGLLPLLGRARALSASLGAQDATDGSGVGTRRTVLYGDLVHSTVLNVRAGDKRYLELLHEHDRIVRARLRERNGVEFKHTGDGIAAWFLSAPDAVECAHVIAADLEEATMLHPDLPLQLRFGLASGSPLQSGADLFGLTVVQAARLCALAEPGQVLVSEEVAASASPHVCRSIGRKALKGFPEPIPVFEALPVLTTVTRAT